MTIMRTMNRADIVDCGEDEKNEMESNAEISQPDVPPTAPHRPHRHLSHAAATTNGNAAKTKLEREVLDE